MVRRARFLEMGVFHQYSVGAGRPVAGSVESSRKQGPQPRPAVRLARRPVGRTGLRRNRLCLVRIVAGFGCSWGPLPYYAVVLGGALIVADSFAPPVPFRQFQRSQPAHLLSLRCVERRSLLFPSRSNTGARLFGNKSGSRPVAFHSVDV